MTNEEAIKYLKQLYPQGGHCWLDEQRLEAINLAIAALQADLDLAEKTQEIHKAYIRGVNEMKQMLIKDAVDAEVSFRIMPDSKDYVSFDTFYTDLSFNEGDKVKLIIIKEN